jgi:hypothetical protein
VKRAHTADMNKAEAVPRNWNWLDKCCKLSGHLATAALLIISALFPHIRGHPMPNKPGKEQSSVSPDTGIS